ncbi:patatin [Mariprofundus erugo]|uniref:patatin-like phospholipase family protein n=1 Tax=Mariprofundus erugo TaxID=2528639 RepID=UPI0010FD3449|nr:patatin-like phospholipase family protein [Mariprofundus erugo]TLS76407.1 patatin [Mariprofundus erugo]
MTSSPPITGLVLGSGSARGWGHIGAIRALQEHSISPRIICGCSIGALVGASLACHRLDELEHWARHLSTRDIIRLLDFSLHGGGVIQGDRLLESFCLYVNDVLIEQLDTGYGAIATNLDNGHECWLQNGSLLDAVRASIALPGLFSPFRYQDQWLVDGGLVNPLPVSMCRAMGADIVIAINLNNGLVGNHVRAKGRETRLALALQESEFLQKIAAGVAERAKTMLPSARSPERIPGIMEVMTGAIDIMQDRITRSCLITDPPDILVSPRLAHMGLLEFDRAEEGIEEGYQSVLAAIRQGDFRSIL